MIDYQVPMLEQVDYSEIEDDDFGFSLVDLEYDTMKNCCDFLEELKIVLMKEKLMQLPELLVAHLCAYLGALTTIHSGTNSEKLEPSILELIKDQADAAYELFNQYPINSMIKSQKEKNNNLDKLREKSPGSIVAQTVRLGRVAMDIINELSANRVAYYFKGKDAPKQDDLFCPSETFIKLMLLMGGEQFTEWKEQLDGRSNHYVLNQMAIQIGWLIGYFAHLDGKRPDETAYLVYGLPVLTLYREQVYKMMHAYADVLHEQEDIEQDKKYSETQALMSEIRHLSKITHAQLIPAVSDFQKQIAITKAGIEGRLVELLNEDIEPKIILMSLFYFWFRLEAPLNGANIDTIDKVDVFSHMARIIPLVINTAQSLPKPELTPEIKALNEKMQELKKHLSDPEHLDKLSQVSRETAVKQTEHVNEAVHTLTCDYIKQNFHPDSITNVLFSQWLRFSVFFGVPESDWQKMDYYLPEILTAVRNYLKVNCDDCIGENI